MRELEVLSITSKALKDIFLNRSEAEASLVFRNARLMIVEMWEGEVQVEVGIGRDTVP